MNTLSNKIMITEAKIKRYLLAISIVTRVREMHVVKYRLKIKNIKS